MIRAQCPHCQKKLGINENLAGRMVICPQCKNKFRAPPIEQEEEPPVLEVVEEEPAPPPRKTKPQNQYGFEPAEEEEEEPRPTKRKRRPLEDDDLDEEEDRPRKRKKKRSKRKSSSADSMDTFTKTMIGLGVFGVVSVGLAFFWHPLILIPALLSSILSLVGLIWFLMVAFQDSAGEGLLCLLVPCYSLYYLSTHFEEEKQPFIVSMLGAVLSVLCSVVGIEMPQ